MPIAAARGRDLAPVQFVRDGPMREPRYLKFEKCGRQRLGSYICGPLAGPRTVAAACVRCGHAQASQYSPERRAMPPATCGGRYSSTIQFLRHCSPGHESRHPDLVDGRCQLESTQLRNPQHGHLPKRMLVVFYQKVLHAANLQTTPVLGGYNVAATLGLCCGGPRNHAPRCTALSHWITGRRTSEIADYSSCFFSCLSDRMPYNSQQQARSAAAALAGRRSALMRIQPAELRFRAVRTSRTGL